MPKAAEKFEQIVQPKKADIGAEFGLRMNMPFATSWTPTQGGFNGPSYELWRGEDENAPSISQLVDMRRTDGQARALYRLVTLPIRSALDGVTWTPAEGGEKEAEFVENMFTLPPNGGGMTSSLNRIVAEMLLAVFDGFAAFEQVYQVPDYGPNKGKIVLRKLAYRPADTVTFLLDDQGGFNGFRQRAYFKGQAIDVGIPRDRAFYFAVQEEERPFYGVSYFQSAFYHYDVKCLTGDTMVPLLDGTEESIAEIARRKQAGEDLWVYSYADGKVVPGRVYAAENTGQKPTVKVTLDNGKSFRCTADHRVLLRDGSYVEAGKLDPGTSLMPLYRQTDTLGRTEYEQVMHPGSTQWQFTHSMVADAVYGPREFGEVVHHRDINPRNNHPDNLQRMQRGDHIALHGQLMRDRWQDPDFRSKVLSDEAIARRRDGVRKFWDDLSEEDRAARIARMQAGRVDRSDVTLESVCDAVRQDPAIEVVADMLGVSVPTVRARVREVGYETWKEFVQSLGVPPVPAHGRSVKYGIEVLEDAVWRIRQRGEDVKFVTVQEEAGLHAPQVYRIVRRAGFGSFVEWRDSLLSGAVNHTVVSVEPDGVEDVYDLQVPGAENFALSSGIFVHNCKLYYLAHLAAQHRAVGTRIGEVPPSASDIDRAKFKAALEDFGVMQAMIVPPGFKIDHQYPSSSFDFMQLINHHNSQMSKSVLASFFDDAQGGDKALVDFGKQSDALFLMGLQAIMADIAYAINTHLIPKFVDWNFGTSKYPTFTWGAFTDEQKEAITDTFSKLSTAGQAMTVSEDFMFELEKIMAEDLGLPVDYEKVEAERQKAKEVAEAQQQQFLGGGQQGIFGQDSQDTQADSGTGQGQQGEQMSEQDAIDIGGKPFTFSGSPVPVSETLGLVSRTSRSSKKGGEQQ